MAVIINNRLHISVAEVAERANVAIPTVYHWLHEYHLPKTMIANKIMVAEDDLSAFFAKKKDRRRKNWKKKPKPETAV
jgi:excisionase family DNA binding protein